MNYECPTCKDGAISFGFIKDGEMVTTPCVGCDKMPSVRIVPEQPQVSHMGTLRAMVANMRLDEQVLLKLEAEASTAVNGLNISKMRQAVSSAIVFGDQIIEGKKV